MSGTGDLDITPIPIMCWYSCSLEIVRFPFARIGIFYSMGASCIWPILERVVDPKMLGIDVFRIVKFAF